MYRAKRHIITYIDYKYIFTGILSIALKLKWNYNRFNCPMLVFLTKLNRAKIINNKVHNYHFVNYIPAPNCLAAAMKRGKMKQLATKQKYNSGGAP